MVLKLVERRPVAHAAKQLVERVSEGTRRVLSAQRAKGRVEFTEGGMRQMRFGRITQFEVMQVAQRNVMLAHLGREFGLADLASRQMQPVALHEFVAIDEDTALGGTGTAPAPRIVKRSEIGDGGTPLEYAGGAGR